MGRPPYSERGMRRMQDTTSIFETVIEKTKQNVLAKDDEGIDVADLEEARKEAFISAREKWLTTSRPELSRRW